MVLRYLNVNQVKVNCYRCNGCPDMIYYFSYDGLLVVSLYKLGYKSYRNP